MMSSSSGSLEDNWRAWPTASTGRIRPTLCRCFNVNKGAIRIVTDVCVARSIPNGMPVQVSASSFRDEESMSLKRAGIHWDGEGIAMVMMQLICWPENIVYEISKTDSKWDDLLVWIGFHCPPLLCGQTSSKLLKYNRKGLWSLILTSSTVYI